jgi:septal ring factor EnvC (AmiA/AmiB activator)
VWEVVSVSGKTRKQITIDPALAEEVDRRDEFNLSGFVNACLEQHFANGNAASAGKAAVRAQIERLESQIDEAEQERERLREQRQRLEEELEDMDDEPALLDQAREKLENTPRDPDNPAIQNWSGKLGIPADELCDRLKNGQDQ